MSAFQFVIIIITDQSGLKPFDLLARPLRKRSNTQRSRNHGMMEQLHEEWQICVGYVALPIAVQHLGGGGVLCAFKAVRIPITSKAHICFHHTGVVHTDPYRCRAHRPFFPQRCLILTILIQFEPVCFARKKR